MAEPGKVVKPRTKSAQFSLGSILTAKGNVIPFFNNVEYLNEGDLVLYDVQKATCNVYFKNEQTALSISIAVIDENYPTNLFEEDIAQWKGKETFRELWESVWGGFIQKNPCGATFLELKTESKEGFECLWKTDVVYLRSLDNLDMMV